MVNKAAIERGLGRVTHILVKSISLIGGSRGDAESFCYPTDDVHGMQLRCNYDTVRAGDGLPEPGTIINKNDCLVGKVATLTLKGSPDVRVCRSIMYDGPDGAVVDSVALTKDTHGNRCAVIKVRCTYNLMEGDKMSSRYGQKGTIGRIMSQENMPFSPRNGMVPDILINPLCKLGFIYFYY